MKTLIYLVRRLSGFYVRIRVPRDLRPRFGQAELKRSLHTLDPDTAKTRALAAAHALRQLFATVRSDPMLPNAEIARLARGGLSGRPGPTT